MMTYIYGCGCRKDYAHLTPTKYGPVIRVRELCGPCFRRENPEPKRGAAARRKPAGRR